MIPRLFLDAEFWKHATIPVVAAAIGWATNWVAIRMTFRPLEFRGIRPWLGWQGIIPSKAGKMAEIFVDRTMYKLGTLRELFHHMEPERIAKHVNEMLASRLDSYTEEILFYGQHKVWRLLPNLAKEQVHARVRQRLPAIVDSLMTEIADNIEDLIDFKHMLVTRLEGDKDLLNRLFLESGEDEFRFIVNSGWHFGFLFGVVQLVVWLVLPEWWVLPVFGIIVGYATNWLALNVIFRPLLPTKIGPWTVQGLFLKRQHRVAERWCALVTTEILTLQHIVYAMLFGKRSERTREIIRRHVEPIVDEVVAGMPTAAVVLDPEARAQIRAAVAEKAIAVSADPFDHWPFNQDRARLIEALLLERMKQMPPAEFQDLLRPCFQEDEMKLILVGAVLGFLAGLAQLVFVF